MMRRLNFNQVLCCLLALGFAVSGIRAARAQADPFPRYIVFYPTFPGFPVV